MTEIFPYLVKNINLQNQEAQQTPNRTDRQGPILRYTLVKLFQATDKKILKATREKQFVMYKGPAIHLMADTSSDSIEARKQ